jgi:hypothetical protein
MIYKVLAFIESTASQLAKRCNACRATQNVAHKWVCPLCAIVWMHAGHLLQATTFCESSYLHWEARAINMHAT